jgi:hypothetical protein
MIKFNIYSILKLILFIGFIILWGLGNYFSYQNISKKEPILMAICIMTSINILVILLSGLLCSILDWDFPFEIINKIDEFCKKERRIKYK